MTLREQMAQHRQAWEAILAVAACRDSIFFADLCWPPFDADAMFQRLRNGIALGVRLTTPRRILVVEEHDGELRYCAGGWASQKGRIHLEQHRIMAEGSESGVFLSPGEATQFAHEYLVEIRTLQDIDVPRQVRYQHATDTDYLIQSRT